MWTSDDFLEWTLTYGWAVVVVLAAIGALFYFGVLPPNPERQGAVFSCDCRAECNTILGDGYNQISCCKESIWKDGKCNNVNQVTRIYMNKSIDTFIEVEE